MKNQCLYNKAVSHWWAKKLSLTRQLKGLQECQMAVSIIPAGRKIAVLLGAWRSNCTEKEYKNDSSGLSKMCFAQSCACISSCLQKTNQKISVFSWAVPSQLHSSSGWRTLKPEAVSISLYLMDLFRFCCCCFSNLCILHPENPATECSTM